MVPFRWPVHFAVQVDVVLAHQIILLLSKAGRRVRTRLDASLENCMYDCGARPRVFVVEKCRRFFLRVCSTMQYLEVLEILILETGWIICPDRNANEYGRERCDVAPRILT